jgi:hypothetical protein
MGSVSLATVALSILLALTGPTFATTVEALDLADLSSRASRIFLATCRESVAEEVSGQVRTRVAFEVTEAIKGSREGMTQVVLPGGELAGRRQWLVGMPAFVPGDRVVLFLSAPDQHGRVWPIGLAQGAFRVVRGPDGEPLVVRSEGKAPTSAVSGSARPVTTPDRRQPLQQFLDEVRSLSATPVRGPDAR